MELYQALITLDGWTFLAQICNLMIQLLIFKKFLLNPVKKVIAERKAKADSQIADAQKLRTEAEAMKAEYEQNLQNARAEANQIVANAQKTATARNGQPPPCFSGFPVIRGSFSPDPVNLWTKRDLCHNGSFPHLKNIPHRFCYLLRKQIGSFLFSLSKVRIPVQICFCHIRLNRHNADTILTHLIKKAPGKAAESRFRCPISTAMRITELRCHGRNIDNCPTVFFQIPQQ